jgi:hypothetical protein
MRNKTGHRYNLIRKLGGTLLIILSIFVFSCKNGNGVPEGKSALKPDSTLGIIVADTITYEVVILNTSAEDPLKEKFLANLDHQVLIDSLFGMIETGCVTAYNYDTNERLSVRQVRKIEDEEGFSRDNIGMIQFTEIWFLNTSTGTMTKKVHSIIPGYNYKTDDGTIIGYSPLFKIIFNPE